MENLCWYPSIGNKSYPYNTWRMKTKEWSWETLKDVAKYYHSICRVLRNKYKWGPNVIDPLEINRILLILQETIEDREEADEDEFED